MPDLTHQLRGGAGGSSPPESAQPRWARRSVLILGLSALGLLVTRTVALATAVRVGSLSFEVPETIRPTVPQTAMGQGWQWCGVRDGGSSDRPATVVLARADLASTEPEEILGLLLASSTTGLMPGLVIGGSRTRAMPGGGDQTRMEVSYAASQGRTYHGTLLVATRPEPPGGLLVVLGDDTLTAGTMNGVLDSARWVS
jgi:hypothetical protein